MKRTFEDTPGILEWARQVWQLLLLSQLSSRVIDELTLTFMKVLASFLLGCIEDQITDQHGKIVTYFFCDDKDNSQNSAELILR